MVRKAHLLTVLLFLSLIPILISCNKTLEKSSPVNFLDNGFKALDAGKLTVAENYFRQAIANDTTSGKPYIGLGHIYKNQKDFYKAEQFYRQALAKDQTLTSVNGFLGELYMMQGDEKTALEYYEKCPTDDPHYGEFHYILGKNQLNSNQIDEAQKSFNTAINHSCRWGGSGDLDRLHTEKVIIAKQ